MSLLLRLLYTFLVSRIRPSCSLLGPCVTPFRVWPNDLDVFMHVNNGRYLTIMDLARFDHMMRSGLYEVLKARGWYPVVSAESIQFITALKLNDAFEIHTEVLGWDAKAFILRQRFFRGDELVTTAVLRARFLSRRGGKVAPTKLLEALDYDGPTPDLPQWVERWNDAQVKKRNSLRNRHLELATSAPS